MRRLLLSALALAWVFAVLGTTPAFSQLAGEVLDPAGTPASGARVELWSPLRRVAVRHTDSAGRFSFSSNERDSASTALVTLSGYEPRSIALASVGEMLTIQLGAVVLPGLTVQSKSRPLCPNADDPDARALWEAASARYTLADSVHLYSFQVQIQEEVDGSELRAIDESRRRPGGRGSRPSGHPILPETGYGFRIEQSWNPAFAAWQYQELGVASERFIEPAFGRYHSLSIRRRDQEHVVLAFCSRGLKRGAVGVQGTLTLNADTTLHSATWEFLAPEPREAAGGETLFVPHGGGAVRPWLVPSVSVYWRKLHRPSDRYFRRWERNVKWSVMPTSGPTLTLEDQANWQDW